jgi:hypothetical protein
LVGGLLAHMNDNAPACSLIDVNPVRVDDPIAQFQATHTTTLGMGIAYLHLYRVSVDVNTRAESRPLARDAWVEDQLPA